MFALAAVFFLWLKARISVDRPGGTQQCMEALLTNSMGVGVRDLLDDNVGHDAPKYVAMLGSIGIFVLICNLLGLFPTFMSPTAEVSVPLGCAIVVFLYYNWVGIVKHGPLGHGKHFLGPVLAMSPIMLPIEIVSNLARLLSLTVRLWVNMFVSETLYVLFLGLMLEMYLFLGHLGKLGYVGAFVPLVGPRSIYFAAHFRGGSAGFRFYDSSRDLCGGSGSGRALISGVIIRHVRCPV